MTAINGLTDLNSWKTNELKVLNMLKRITNREQRVSVGDIGKSGTICGETGLTKKQARKAMDSEWKRFRASARQVMETASQRRSAYGLLVGGGQGGKRDLIRPDPLRGNGFNCAHPLGTYWEQLEPIGPIRDLIKGTY